MTLTTGSRLGPYEISAPLGAGGMGEVYRARDTRLGREVAVKVLPDGFAQDADRLRRFEQEARAVSALNHPNILTIHDFGREGGTAFLVTELLSGESLREPLRRGPLPVKRAVEIAIQVARGLAAAHEKGIVHRDLKPENLFITRDGGAKILDFGLARRERPEVSGAGLAEASTMLETEAGMVLGTVGYMAPEQVRGERADSRADLFALGCVLYEMLGGRRAFPGATAVESLNAILKEEPAMLLDSGRPIPPALDRVVRHCLEKNPAERFQTARDLAFDLEAVSGVSLDGATPPRRAARVRRVALILGGLILAAVAGALVTRSLTRPAANAPPPRVRFALNLPATLPLSLGFRPAVALSPDGHLLAFAAREEGRSQIFLRSLDELDPRPIAGTEGGSGPFFSPDGSWLGFWAGAELKKVLVAGGAAVTLCECNGLGGSWATNDEIFLDQNMAIFRVAAHGGTPELVVAPDASRGELGYAWPAALPGGKGLLYAFWSGGAQYSVAALSFDSGERRTLIKEGTAPRYSPTGHLVYTQAGKVLAAPFDVGRLQVTGPAVPIVDGVMMEVISATSHAAFADNGSFAYVPGALQPRDRKLLWVDRSGESRPASDLQRAYWNPRISPDGQRLALSITGGAESDIWIMEPARNTLTRLTSEAGTEPNAIWTPDGARLTFASDRAGPFNVYSIPADGSGTAEILLPSKRPLFPTSWSPDGKVLAAWDVQEQTGWDVSIVTLEPRGIAPFLSTKFSERAATFSPNGRWLAYVSNVSGRPEVYVQAYPDAAGKWQASTQGGDEPVWARSGKELFYRQRENLMAVTVTTDGAFRSGPPRALFAGSYLRGTGGFANYDVSPDGQHFLMMRGEQEAAPTQIQVVLNWTSELRP